LTDAGENPSKIPLSHIAELEDFDLKMDDLLLSLVHI